MTFLGLEARTDLPKVAYPTALDFFVFLSFAFIFATILQFAVVHYFTKYGSGECYFNFYEETSSDSEAEDEEEEDFFQQTPAMSTSHLSSLSQIEIESYGVIPLSRLELDIDDGEKPSSAIKSLRKFMTKYFFCLRASKDPQDRDDVSRGSVIDSIRECEHQIVSGASTATQNTPQCRRHSSKQPRSQSGGFRRNFNSVSKIDKVLLIFEC